MRKIIASMNITLDGFCDHTAGIADEELHQHFTDLIRNAGGILYGRTTYRLMESYWPELVKNPSGNKADDDFALAIHNVPKIVFSRTLKQVTWENSRLGERELKDEVLALKAETGKNIFVGSPSLIAALHKIGLLDEYQLCVHPVIVGTGLQLFKNINERSVLKLINIKTFGSGVLALHYARTNEHSNSNQ